jgi:pSer/pThr/pTyr-binding forkhead associated (FHA) protein
MARLVVFGPEGPRSYELDGPELSIGRSKKSHVVLEDGAASRNHCYIRRDPEDTFTLVDLGSANGTHVNGVKVSEQALEPEDRIKIGKTILVFKEH